LGSLCNLQADKLEAYLWNQLEGFDEFAIILETIDQRKNKTLMKSFCGFYCNLSDLDDFVDCSKEQPYNYYFLSAVSKLTNEVFRLFYVISS